MFSKILNKKFSLRIVETVRNYPKTTIGIFCGSLFNLNLYVLSNKNVDKDLFETILLIA